MQGYLRSDGRKGIRNVVVVAYLVECAHHVAREIALPLRERGVHLIGFPGCYPNAYARADHAAALHASERRAPCSWSRWAARASTAARWPTAIAASRPAGRDAGDPGVGRHAPHRSPPAGRGSNRRCGSSIATPAGRDGRRRTGRRHDLRRLRRHQRPDGQSGRRPGLRSAGRARGHGHLRGDRRADRLRALHGRAGRHAASWAARSSPRVAQGRPLLPHARPRQLRPGQRRRRADDDRGEVAGGLLARAASRRSPA